MSNGDETFQSGSGSGQAVPSGAGTPPIVSPGDPQQSLQQISQRLLSRLGQQRSSITPTNIPHPQAVPVASGIARNRNEGIQMFTQNLFALIANASAAHKEHQIRHAVASINALNNAWQKAQDMSNGDQKKAVELFKQMPEVTEYLDPRNKDLKQMSKLLQMDFLNPEKNKTVWHEALSRVGKATGVEQAMKGVKALLGQHKQQPSEQDKVVEDIKSHQQARESAGKLAERAPVQPRDPKEIENLVSQARLEREHQENVDLRKQQATENYNLRKDQLNTQKMMLEERLRSSDLNRDERIRHDKEMEKLRGEQLQILRDKAAATKADEDWAEVVRRQGLTSVPASQRSSVVKYMHDNGMSIPKPLAATEQKVLDDSIETTSKIQGWQADLNKLRDPKTGKLPNKPFSFFSGALAYKFGVNTPESALISDFSRERWQAIGGLLRGIRRGDIIRDIVQHTPDPYKDSAELMSTKLDRLQHSYDQARKAILKAHGFDIDPSSGESIEEPKGDEFGFEEKK